VAIVASLTFVGVQLRQNTKAAEIAAYQSRVTDASGALASLSLSEVMLPTTGLRCSFYGSARQDAFTARVAPEQV
jgi:hypothetical protein